MQTKLFNSYFSDFLEMLKSKIIIRDQVASNEYSDHGGTWYMVHGTLVHLFFLKMTKMYHHGADNDTKEKYYL